jgi:hypothetical protein
VVGHYAKPFDVQESIVYRKVQDNSTATLRGPFIRYS